MGNTITKQGKEFTVMAIPPFVSLLLFLFCLPKLTASDRNLQDDWNVEFEGAALSSEGIEEFVELTYRKSRSRRHTVSFYRPSCHERIPDGEFSDVVSTAGAEDGDMQEVLVSFH